MALDVVKATEGASLPRRENREVSQRFARMESAAAMELARMRALEAVESARLEAIERVSKVAVGEATSIHQYASLHAGRNPKLAPRLTYIAEEATLAMGSSVGRFGRTVG